MARFCCFWLLSMGSISAALAAGKDLVNSGDFVAAGPSGFAANWTPWTPVWDQARCQIEPTKDGLRVHAQNGSPYAVGGAWQQIEGIEPGKAYAITALCRAEKIAAPYQSVLVRLGWTRKGKPLHPAGCLVRGPIVTATALEFRDVLIAPEQADGARLSLDLKWPHGGSVCWKQVSMRRTDPPPPRKAKVGTVHFRPRGSTPQKNLDLYCQQIDEAGRLKLDIVCLPEAITMVGTGKDVNAVAEPIPGPSTQQLGEAARRNNLWVVAGLTERDGPLVYNTAVLLDRKGQLAGKYRKVHLPREEWLKGIAPGTEYPVFQTDFGVIAIQICYDWFFPEIDTIFALRGAEIVFAPTWGTTFPDKEGRVEGESVFRVRARDNGIYLVPSVFDGSSMVIDPLGRILASNKGQTGVFWAEVDLSLREPLFWVGHWRAIGPRDRMPSTYGPLTGEAPTPDH